MSDRTMTATVLSVEKLGGDLQHFIQTSHGGYRTAKNSSINFEVAAYQPRKQQNIWPIVTLTLRRSRRYEYIVNIHGKNAIELGLEQSTQIPVAN